MGILERTKLPTGEVNPFPNCVFYGDPGGGKTTLAGGSPDPAFLDFEDSTDTIQVLISKGLLPTTIGIWKPKNLDETWELSREIVKSGNYGTLVIDTGTRQQIQQMRHYIENHPSVKPPAGSNRTASRDKYTVQLADYGFSYKILDEYYDWLCKQPIRVIINTHAKSLYKVSTAENGAASNTLVRIEPDLTPKLTKSLQELFSVVGYLTSKPGMGNSPAVRELQINPTAITVAKNRLHIQENKITNPTYKGLFNL